jgi:hypothetical protein
MVQQITLFRRQLAAGTILALLSVIPITSCAAQAVKVISAASAEYLLAEAEATPVTVTVDWAKKAGVPTTRFSYALNLYKGTDEKSAGSPEYRANLEYMNPGIIRIHNAGKMKDSGKSWDGIVDEANRTWDRSKIKQVLSLSLAQKPAILLNIPGWPSWMDADKDGFLDKDQFSAYAAMLADLVRIVNVENKSGVRYWRSRTNWTGATSLTSMRAAGAAL